MIDAIHLAASALRANQEWLDTISGNVANINSPAYQAKDTRFLAAIQSGEPASPLVTATSGIGEQRTGDIRQTGRELDVAINGRGFFRVVDADGRIAYTRLGRFVVNSDGAVGLPTGQVLADTLFIPPDALAVRIAGNGEVSVTLPGEASPVVVGALHTVDIEDLASLDEVAPGLHAARADLNGPEAGAPGTDRRGALQQGHLEYSNVDLIDEMSKLVLAQRAYQLNARILQAGDQALAVINNLVR